MLLRILARQQKMSNMAVRLARAPTELKRLQKKLGPLHYSLILGGVESEGGWALYVPQAREQGDIRFLVWFCFIRKSKDGGTL